jgi:peptidoglycan hydrolase-like protein with peptidoglycan-binding domain
MSIHRGRFTGALAALAAGLCLAFAGMAPAGTGGVGIGGDDGDAGAGDTSYRALAFGERDLRLGNRGDDVKTLNWLLRAQALGAPSSGDFLGKTERAVRSFQSSIGVSATGVVKKSTRKGFVAQMALAHATWYGPGFWGNGTACGQTLKTTTIGVAHKKLPCGTRVIFAYRGNWVRATVIDRGPYNAGYQWDLTRALAKRLDFLATGAGALRVAVER